MRQKTENNIKVNPKVRLKKKKKQTIKQTPFISDLERKEEKKAKILAMGKYRQLQAQTPLYAPLRH